MTYESITVTRGDTDYEYLVCPTHGKWLYITHSPRGSVVYGKHYCEKCEREAAEQEAWGRSGIPPRFQVKTFDAYEATSEGQRKALGICRRYAETFTERLANGDSLVLAGAPGTGKTHLACAIGGEVVRSGRSALFLSMRELVTRVTDTWGGKGSEATELAALTKPDLLIIDEVAGESGSDTERRVFFAVLNARYESLRPVILITNAGAAALKSYLGERAYSRLCETAGLILFTWESHRGDRLTMKKWAAQA